MLHFIDMRLFKTLCSVLLLLSMWISNSHHHEEHSEIVNNCSICHLSSDKELIFIAGNTVVLETAILKEHLVTKNLFKKPIYKSKLLANISSRGPPIAL